MKAISKRALVRRLRDAGCWKESEVGPHEKWQCPCGDHSTAVPRHRQVSAGVCRNLIIDLPCLSQGWLQ